MRYPLTPDVGKRGILRNMRCLRFTLLFLLIASAVSGGSPPDEVWVRTWNGPGNHDDLPNVVALDGLGSVYVAGSTYENGVGANQEDFAVLKYDLGGNLLWSRVHGEVGPDIISALLVAAPDRIAVTGFSADGPDMDVATIMYDDAGSIVWEQRFRLDDHPLLSFSPRMVRDANGNLLVSAHTPDDYLVLKYSPTGSLLWSRTYDGTQGEPERATDIAVDAQGNVYVTGIVGFGFYTTVKYDANGVFQWDQHESGHGSVFDFCALEIGPDGNVIVVGDPESTCGVFSVSVWKVSASTGDALWLESYPPHPCHSMEPTDFAIDASGNIFIAGFGIIGGSEYHYQTLKYSTDGDLLWARTYDGPGGSSDVTSGIALDSSGAAYITGLTTFPPQNRDFSTVKYAANGDEEWSRQWAGPFGTNDGATDIAVSESGDVFLAGHGYNPVQQENAVLIRYRQMEPAGAPAPAPSDGAAMLWAMENPCHDGSGIRYYLQEAAPIRLVVHDALGREIRVLRSGFEPGGSHEVRWDAKDVDARRVPAGTYFVRLVLPAEESVSTRITVMR